MSFVGVITGVVGTVTGIAGAAMGYVGYRRSVKMKALDLRLELRKAENTLRDRRSAPAPSRPRQPLARRGRCRDGDV
jgi:hypothetical protein